MNLMDLFTLFTTYNFAIRATLNILTIYCKYQDLGEVLKSMSKWMLQ